MPHIFALAEQSFWAEALDHFVKRNIPCALNQLDIEFRAPPIM